MIDFTSFFFCSKRFPFSLRELNPLHSHLGFIRYVVRALCCTIYADPVLETYPDFESLFKEGDMSTKLLTETYPHLGNLDIIPVVYEENIPNVL